MGGGVGESHLQNQIEAFYANLGEINRFGFMNFIEEFEDLDESEEIGSFFFFFFSQILKSRN